MPDPRTQIVSDGYDTMGATFAEWRTRIVDDPRRDWEQELTSRLPEGARLLELGCGSGPPETQRLARQFDAFNHVPRDLLAPLLTRAYGWLVPGGRLLTAFGVSDTEGWTGDWLGAQTFFSSYPAETNSRLVREAGFTIERDEVVELQEPEDSVDFQWVLACA